MLANRSCLQKIAGFCFGMVCLGMQPALVQAESFLITVVDARIAPTKSDGKAWDLGFFRSKLPDPFVVITAGKQELRTPIVRNSLSPRWNISKTWTLQDHDKITIVVWDRDRLSKNDLIGKTDMTFKELRQYETLTFGQVLALQIKVVSLSPQPRVIPPPPVVERLNPQPPVSSPPEKHQTPPAGTTPPTAERPSIVERPVAERPSIVERPVAKRPSIVERPVAERPVSPRVVPVPQVRESTSPESPTSQPHQKAAAPTAADKVRDFCIVMIRQSLFCMKKQQEELLKSGDARQLRMATALEHALKVAEKALQEQGRALESMLVRCRATIQQEGWIVSAECIQCAKRQGCVRSSVLKKACRDVCLTRKSSEAIPTAPPLLPPPVQRVEKTPSPAPASPRVPVPTEQAPKQPVPRPDNSQTPPSPTRKESMLPLRQHPSLIPVHSETEQSPESLGERKSPGATATKSAEASTAPASQPVSRPVQDATLSVEAFCAKFVAQRLHCLASSLDQEKRLQKRVPLAHVSLLEAMVHRLRGTQSVHTKRCIDSVKREQQRRLGSTQQPLSSVRVAACWSCLQRAGCSHQQQKTCRRACVE